MNYQRFLTIFQELIYICSKKIEDRVQKPVINKFIEEIASQKEFPIFQLIEIETINRCNFTCSFCPVNKKVDPRPYKRMDTKLFYKIIEQLKEMNYSNAICLFSNNEPLLDNRIIEFSQIARQSLPNAFLYLYTNGSLLTVKKLIDLMKYLDKLTIDNYNDKLVLNEPVKKIHDFLKNSEYNNKVKIVFRRLNQVRNTRAGQAENRYFKIPVKSSCILPFAQMVVRPDGMVSLCCNDARGEMSLGDLTKDSIMHVWNSEKYNQIRNLIIKGRSMVSLCGKCDSFDFDGSEFICGHPNFQNF